MRIFAINPGSTSTKIALYDGESCLWNDTQRYDTDVTGLSDQEQFRFDEITKALETRGASPKDFSAVVGRGGLIKPVKGGVYRVNTAMLEDLRGMKYGAHASNLGAPLAHRFAAEAGKIPAFIVDPVVVDELADEARFSGLPEIPRISIFHALNQKAVARRAAAELKKDVTGCNLIVAHMGGGVSVGAHEKGRVIDVNNALDGEGPMSPERSGSLPTGGLVSMCFSGKYAMPEIRKMINGKGGLVAHLGTNDLREVERRIADGDAQASLVFEAMALQIAKEIGRCAAVLKGEVDAVVLTGGLAHSDKLCERVASRVSFIAPVLRYPGEDEMEALARGALRALRGEESPREYE
ncbi:MAG: butyrate kinase [Synergistaceae bacterium]|nr:butyrate kinase [Synergistaceae bacterium]